MTIYMTHPLHGTHIVYSLAEVDACKVHGWIVKPPKQEVIKSTTITVPKKDKAAK